jgi:ligand-binding sensor domain-containing protein
VRLQLPTTVQAFDEDDGLADNLVHAVVVDGDGIVWVGTEQGLSRFDPVLNDFTEFNDELPDEQVLALALDGDILWIGTGDGAARYDTTNDLWTYFDATDLAGHVVHAVAVDTDGAVWLGCGPGMGGTGGLTRYNGP